MPISGFAALRVVRDNGQVQPGQRVLVMVDSEGRGRWLGGFDRQLPAVALSRFVGQRLRILSSTPRQEDLQTLQELLEAGKVNITV